MLQNIHGKWNVQIVYIFIKLLQNDADCSSGHDIYNTSILYK